MLNVRTDVDGGDRVGLDCALQVTCLPNSRFLTPEFKSSCSLVSVRTQLVSRPILSDRASPTVDLLVSSMVRGLVGMRNQKELKRSPVS